MAVGAVSVVLLGVTKIGSTPLAPGRDTGFDYTVMCAAGGDVCFTTDVGNIDAALQLDVRTPVPDTSRAWRARLGLGPDLHVSVRDLDGVRQRLIIDSQEGGGELDQFVWPSGTRLLLWSDSTSVTRVEDWFVYTAEGPYDSKDRETQRTALFWLSLILLGLSATAAAVKAFEKPPPPKPVTAREIVERVVDTIDGESPADTGRLRDFLQDVLFTPLTVDQALDKILTPDERESPARRAQVLFRARKGFKDRFAKLERQLATFKNELYEGAPPPDGSL